MKRFALLGEPLGHSLSPLLHKAIYRQLEMDDATYRTVELPEERLKSFFTGFKVGGFDGVNVTIPHKSAVIPLLDEVDSKAKHIGAVNCINRSGNILTGHNTDILGFAYSLRQHEVIIEDSEFAIIGAGGSAAAVGAVLAEGAAKRILIVNRSEESAARLRQTILGLNEQVEVCIINEADLIKHTKQLNCVINTTPVGMSPDTSGMPISAAICKALFNEDMFVFDLIYNPLKTEFLQMAEHQGAEIVNGLQMLAAQAVYSVEIWMGGNIVAHVDINALVRDLEKSIK